MKVRIIIGSLLWLLSPLSALAAGDRLVCEQFVDDGHAYAWQQLRKNLPSDLGPGDEFAAYKRLKDLYVAGVSDADKEREVEVQQFVNLLTDVANGARSGNMAIRPGDEGDEVFVGAASVMDIRCKSPLPKAVVEMAYVVIAVKKVHDQSWSTLMGASSERIQQLSQRYADWFNNGLAMWPLETWANGLLLEDRDSADPLDWQLVVARPSLGIGLNTGDAPSENDPEATLAIEPLGFVRYGSLDYSEYWGLSLLLTVGEDEGIGYGLLYRRNNFVIGASKRDEDLNRGISGDDVYLFIGMDLYDLVHEKEDLFSGFKKKVREHIAQLKAKGGL